MELNAARAAARDAVHLPLDIATLLVDLAATGLGLPVLASSRAADRTEYLRRPDLGRLPGDLTAVLPSAPDIGLVLADGLSPRAVNTHGPAMVHALVRELRPEFSIAPPVVASQARVALGDHVAAALRATTVILLIGERPGLSVTASVGIYLTHRPSATSNDADRNCISNIHPPDGLGYQEAATLTARLLAQARAAGRSGVLVKDTGATARPWSASVTARDHPEIG
jgi:ethanolamine ammonia-lyase small subunit